MNPKTVEQPRCTRGKTVTISMEVQTSYISKTLYEIHLSFHDVVLDKIKPLEEDNLSYISPLNRSRD